MNNSIEAVNETANVSQKDFNKSPSYPSSEIQEIIEFITRIYTDLGYTQYHDKELIAKALGFAWSSIKMKISTSVQYGLLELKHGVGYKITQLFIQIHRPVNEEERRSGYIQVIKNPELYSRLIDEYNNDVIPNASVLGTLLFRRYNIIERVSEKAADIFIANLKNLGLLTSENRLNIDGGIANESSEILLTESENEIKPKELPAPKYTTQIIQNELIEIPIPLKSGKKAFLKIPEEINPEDIERIAKFVDALR